ncbi:MAG: hypothetical protein M1817_003599 [Caeruleum heppii]|nr:MAG: hypothetical protein M1817_003599 [Caeruleum heppii]
MNCERAWKEALEHCRQVLGDDDYDLIVSFENPDKVITTIKDLEDQYAKSPVTRMLRNMKPQLSRLQTFAAVIFLSVGANISAACLWGCSVLLIELASQSEQALGEIAKVLNELGQQLNLFEIYSESLELDPQLLETFFDVLVDLVLNTVAAIKHFRKNDMQTAVVIATWSTVHSQFADTLKNIASRVQHLQKLVEAQNIAQLTRTQARLAQSLSQLTTNASVGSSRPDTHARPCNTLPYQRNPGFYGRLDLLQEIRHRLELQEASQVRSLALWGTGGIGKSQVALEYAQQQWQAGTSVILWIASETEAELAKAFNEAACRLGLDGYLETNTPDQNRYLVLQWLQITDTPWLLIFDNVEDHTVLRENWPTTGTGTILVTCRSELLAASPATVAIEVPTFTGQESGELMLKILNRTDAGLDEVLAARELSAKLGGLALAIDIIAKQIKVRKRFKSVREFLPYYDEHRRMLQKRPKRGIFDPYYAKDIDTVWQTAFEHLTPDAAHLMALFCFLAPEAIPQWLMESKGDLPEPWCFLSDPERYLHEIQCFSACEETLALTLDNCEFKDSPTCVPIYRAFASLYERTGRSIRACENARKVLDILLTEPQEKNVMANCYSDMGYTLTAAYRGEEGLEWMEKALALAETEPESTRHQGFNIDRFLRNHGRANMQLGRYDTAIPDFEKAEHYQVKIHGANSHFDGECKYELGKIAAQQEDLSRAYELYQHAYRLVSPSKPTHSSVMATLYHQGLVCMQRDEDEEALRHFRDALTICQLNEAQRGNQGESVRVKWRMSQIMERQGLADEAQAYRAAAEETKQRLQATGDYAVGITADDSWDTFLGILYR